MTTRRVRASPEFFLQLDAQLPAAGPTAAQFDAYELPAIFEAFVRGWDTLPELRPGQPDVRVLIGQGRLVHAWAVVGILTGGGWIELVTVTIDTTGPGE